MLTKPQLAWAQDKTRVLITVKSDDLSDEEIVVHTDALEIRGRSSDPDRAYSLRLELFADVDPNDSATVHFRLGGRVKIDLRKRDTRIWWPRLAKAPQKLPYVQVDWERWVDSDDEDDIDDGTIEMPNLTDMDLTDPGEYAEEEE